MAAWTRICCAIDFSPPSHAAMELAADVAARDRAELVLVHVFNPPRPATVSADMLAYAPPDLEAEALRDLEREMERFRADAERLAGAGRVDTLLLPGKPSDELAHLVRDRGFDLVVVGTHGRTGVRRLVLGSVAEQIVRSSPVAVLVAKSPEA